MARITLTLPKPALDEIQRQLDTHNESTGATLELTSYLERVLLEIAGMPALQAAIPALEVDRDQSFQASIKAKQAEIVESFTEKPT